MSVKSRARRRVVRVALLACAVAALGACARRLPVAPPPSATKHPDFVYPVVPPDMQRTPAGDRVELGWRYLQNDDLSIAALQFRGALTRSPGFHPALTGQGYVALAKRDYALALDSFDDALRRAGTYVPALVGRGQSLLALKREDEALEAFERALATDASLTDLRRRVEVLRFRNVQETIEAAGKAASAGRLEDARAAYRRALEQSPDSAFLHREIGGVERRRGDTIAALEHFRRASDLDASDIVSLMALGELLEARQDYAAAESAYRRVASLEPSVELTERIADTAERAREAALPPEFHTILQSAQITRGDLAALIGVRLEAVLRDVPATQRVITDTRGHWASSWIAAVAGAGVVEPFENHTFQPRSRIQRVDLAAAASRVITLLSMSRPELRAHLEARPTIADMSQRHLSYPAVADAVAADVLPLLEADRFQPSRPVSGLEAIETIDRLKTLAASPR